MAKKPIVITKVFRTRKTIRIRWTQGDSAFDLEETENPLPAFLVALESLVPLVSTICHFPPDYVVNDCRVCGVIMGCKGGTETVSLDVRKGLDDAAKEFKFKTPERLLSQPTEEGTYTPPLIEAQAALVQDLLEQAKAYVLGDRAQGELPIIGLRKDEDADDEGEKEDPKQGRLIEMPAQTEKPKRTRKPKAEAVAP